jgi:hypothetical protein
LGFCNSIELSYIGRIKKRYGQGQAGVILFPNLPKAPDVASNVKQTPFSKIKIIIMWQPLIQVNQLRQGSRVRQTLSDGNFQHESIYSISNIGNFYFLAQYIEQNGTAISSELQIVTPYRTNGIPYYGFEIWVD